MGTKKEDFQAKLMRDAEAAQTQEKTWRKQAREKRDETAKLPTKGGGLLSWGESPSAKAAREKHNADTAAQNQARSDANKTRLANRRELRDQRKADRDAAKAKRTNVRTAQTGVTAARTTLKNANAALSKAKTPKEKKAARSAVNAAKTGKNAAIDRVNKAKKGK